MTGQDMPGITMFGRAVKPVAAGLTILMVTLLVANLEDTGVLGDSRWGDVVAVAAGAAAVALTAGWWARDQRMAEVGLLLAAGVYITRAVFILATVGVTAQGVYLSLGGALIAAGSYVLEVRDPRGRNGAP